MTPHHVSRRTRTARLALFSLASAILASPIVIASQMATADGIQTLNVRAYIDGRSQLILHDGVAQWHHFEFAAPGRWFGHDEPTTLNGVQWFPNWPQPGENRCGDCHSDPATLIAPPISHVTSVSLSATEARGPVTIVETPSTANGYTTVIQFDDNALGGPAWYDVTLRFPGTPAPSCGTSLGAVVQGDPGFAAHQAEGVYLWQDSTGKMHLRTTHPGRDRRVFRGTITTSGTISSLSRFHLENNDATTIIDGGHTLTFKLANIGALDGVDFTLCDSAILTFAGRVAGRALTPSQVFLGAGRTHPSTVPFTLSAP